MNCLLLECAFRLHCLWIMGYLITYTYQLNQAVSNHVRAVFSRSTMKMDCFESRNLGGHESRVVIQILPLKVIRKQLFNNG